MKTMLANKVTFPIFACPENGRIYRVFVTIHVEKLHGHIATAVASDDLKTQIAGGAIVIQARPIAGED